MKYLGLGDVRESGVVGTVYVPQSLWLASTTNLFVRAAGGDPLALVGPSGRSSATSIVGAGMRPVLVGTGVS